MFGFILHLCVVSRLIIFRQFRFISTLVKDYFSRSGFFFHRFDGFAFLRFVF